MKLTYEKKSMLQQYREYKGLTPEQLAEKVALSAQTIRNIEQMGVGHPASIRKLVDALGIPATAFYGIGE